MSGCVRVAILQATENKLSLSRRDPAFRVAGGCRRIGIGAAHFGGGVVGCEHLFNTSC